MKVLRSNRQNRLASPSNRLVASLFEEFLKLKLFTPITAEDPYAYMENNQMISMIHFFVKREVESTNEVKVESNSFEFCLVRMKKNIIQRVKKTRI